VHTGDYRWQGTHSLLARDFINHNGIPEWLIVDGAMEQGGRQNTAWQGSLKTYHIKQTFTEPYSPWQNRAKDKIREMKRDIKKMMQQANLPRRLWNCLGDLVAKKRRVTTSSIQSMRNAGTHAPQACARVDTGYIDADTVQMVPVGLLPGP
jgi:hypothetical protein